MAKGEQVYPEWLKAAAERVRHLRVGRHLVYHEVTGSTNDDARRLAEAGAPDGLVVLADEQTHGRGRLGRAWVSPPGASLLLSALFRLPLPLAQAARLTMIMGLAALDAIGSACGLEAALKWPNDILLQGRKCGGILAELEGEGERLRWAVVGLGLNVNFSPAQFSELAATATSLQDCLGRPVDRGELLVALLRSLSSRYARLRRGQSPFPEWQSKLAMLGQEVVVEVGQEEISGLAELVTEWGTLIIRKEDGSRQELTAGDVRVRLTGEKR